MKLNELKRIVALLRERVSVPHTVKDKEEAEEFTRNDPCGYTWEVGEEYYTVKELIND